MLHLTGSRALSAFRSEKLLVKARSIFSSIQSVSVLYIHLVHVHQPLTPDAHARLVRLLDYGDPAHFNASGKELLLLVGPRAGTISPWSSKATDIARNCELSAVQRIERGVAYYFTLCDAATPNSAQMEQLQRLIHDRMTETVFRSIAAAECLFVQTEPKPLQSIDILKGGKAALQAVNQSMGLALSEDEMDYLLHHFAQMQRNPTDVELMMFAQANSEHCRHKIFNADWTIDGEKQAKSLFGMIRNTYEHAPQGVLKAYCDNASVIKGFQGAHLSVDPESGAYRYTDEQISILMKVETHNHPTAISPYSGASTGAGGEIRDEAATGRGSSAKAGLCGFSVSNLRIPGFIRPWERDNGKPDRIASALQIMLEGPMGAAAFNNEFGRPNITGYFRTYEDRINVNGQTVLRGYHKPIMIAGGLGNIRSQHIEKLLLPEHANVIVLGGPAMLIGLGGGAASSVASGQSHADLDFASVQRDNPEMQRRCQEVIDSCVSLGEKNPILSIHDVGAGGLSNALPELLHDGGRGGRLDLRAIPCDEPGMSPMEIWCNESQERFVLAVTEVDLAAFVNICQRERCPYAILGKTTHADELLLQDRLLGNNPVEMPLNVLLGKLPKTQRQSKHVYLQLDAFAVNGLNLETALDHVLTLPAVASKSFLITIADRSVGGLVARDQMVGPWQTPVADVGVTASGFYATTGEAMAMGERTPLALVSAPASGRMAVGEALTNILAADIATLSDIKLSANWMAAAGHGNEDIALFDTVKTVGEELCPALGIAIPVGKDSLSMRTAWQQDHSPQEMTAPLSLIVSAFAPVQNICRTLTPLLDTQQSGALYLLDLGQGRQRLGCSALAQVFNATGDEVPDLSNPELIKQFFSALRELKNLNAIQAYHDRSDGGLLITLCEMAFATRCGLDIDTAALGDNAIAALFNEELGVVLQIFSSLEAEAIAIVTRHGLQNHLHRIGTPVLGDSIRIRNRDNLLLTASRSKLQQRWSETSYRMQALRDNPDCAQQEYASIEDTQNPGLHVHLTFKPAASPAIHLNARPRVAILREQGVNGHHEMAAAFDRAGFTAVDVHMSDLQKKRHTLSSFSGIAACGGFSYGDVLGAGGGWAKSILFNNQLLDQFAEFFSRNDTFGLGVCNGCQMMSHLKGLIPGAAHWPQFHRNESEQYEARLCLVEIQASPSLFLKDMAGSRIPIVVSHGEGRAVFGDLTHARLAVAAIRYVDNRGQATQSYPHNPNGSQFATAGVTSQDGRFTILMPHPERVFRTAQLSWYPDNKSENSPWLQMFINARHWLG